tara:strand:+ start:1138 stop:1431 length:294 start_codon:yes stop_codon:yes gene_type:complete
VALKDCALGGGIIVPDPDSAVPRAGGNYATGGVDRNIVNWAFMAHEFVSPGVGFQRGGQDDSIHRARNDLFEVRSKDALSDLFSVLFESFHQVRIFV